MLVYYPNANKLLYHGILPNKRLDKFVDLHCEESHEDKGRKITGLDFRAKSTFEWDVTRSSFYPLTLDQSADDFACLECYQNGLANRWIEIPGSLGDLTSIAFLSDFPIPSRTPEVDDIQLDESFRWTLMQHYTSSDGPCGNMSIVQMRRTVNYVSRMLVAVSFNHVVWAETDQDGRSESLNIATFARAKTSETDECEEKKVRYSIVRARTLNIPEAGALPILYYTDDIAIDETLGVILLYSSGKLCTLHFA